MSATGAGTPMLRVARRKADEKRREAHDEDRDEKRVLAPHEIPEPAEHQRTEGADRKPGGERQQRKDECAGRVQCGKELLGDDRGERPVEIEVIPLEYGTQAGSEHDFLVARGQAVRRCSPT